MTVIVKPDHRAPTAVHMLWVRVGSMDEVDGTSRRGPCAGAHDVQGHARVKPGEFSRRVAALGGRENAFTARDYTGYYQQIPANRWKTVMKLEADRFANNQWPDDRVRAKSKWSRKSAACAPKTTRVPAVRALNAPAVFVASPYRRPIVGWMSDLDAMTPPTCALSTAAGMCRPTPWWWRAMWMWRRCASGPKSITAAFRRAPGAAAQAAH
jgi:zinc protease